MTQVNGGQPIREPVTGWVARRSPALGLQRPLCPAEPVTTDAAGLHRAWPAPTTTRCGPIAPVSDRLTRRHDRPGGGRRSRDQTVTGRSCPTAVPGPASLMRVDRSGQCRDGLDHLLRALQRTRGHRAVARSYVFDGLGYRRFSGNATSTSRRGPPPTGWASAMGTVPPGAGLQAATRHRWFSIVDGWPDVRAAYDACRSQLRRDGDQRRRLSVLTSRR